MSALADHLWQSLLCTAVIGLLAWLTCGNSAQLRLWLWRVAAAKWLLPFALLSAIGGWFGFPARFAGDPPPATVVALVERFSPWFSAGGWFQARWAQLLLLVALLLAAAATARWILHDIHREFRRAEAEQLRLEIAPDDREPSAGFLRAALITTCALVAIATPLLAGAIRSSAHAHEILLVNTQSFGAAKAVLRPAQPGLGSRFLVNVDPRGVLIRNITVHELTAMAYGVNGFFVRGEHFRGSGEDWLVDARYDVRIEAPVVEPDHFDSYALRQVITRELATNFGLEIYVNNECQKPCGKWGERVLIEVSPGSWALLPVEQAGKR